MILTLIEVKGKQIDLTSELIEVIVTFNENTEVKANEDVANKLDTIWDKLVSLPEFITIYNKLKGVLSDKRQKRREEAKMQAIINPIA